MQRLCLVDYRSSSIFHFPRNRCSSVCARQDAASTCSADWSGKRRANVQSSRWVPMRTKAIAESWPGGLLEGFRGLLLVADVEPDVLCLISLAR